MMVEEFIVMYFPKGIVHPKFPDVPAGSNGVIAQAIRIEVQDSDGNVIETIKNRRG